MQETVFRTDCGFLFDIGMSSVLCIFYSQGIKDIPFMDSATSGANRAKALDQATDFAKRAKELLYIVVNLLLIVIILRNPMLSSESDIDKNYKNIRDILPVRTSITRQLSASKVVIPQATPNTFQTDIRDTASKRIVYDYIRDKMLEGDVSTIGTDPVSPMHKTMLLMGCYGDRWGALDELLKQDYMKPGADSKSPFFVNLMLQALDSSQTQHVVSGETFTTSTYDQSTCNCLRDFASPSLLNVREDSEQECNSNKLYYTHDSCSVSRLYDYAVDGAGAVNDNTMAAKERMLVPFGQGMPLRNRVDPILAEITAYEYQLQQAAGDYTVKTLADDTVLHQFTAEYCKYAGFVNASIQRPPIVTALACPEDWKNAGVLKTSLLLSVVMTRMKTWPAYMHTYNKLRTPVLDPTQNDITDAIRLQGSNEARPKITHASFETYIEKYRVAFETCALVGVPHYSTKVTGYTESVHWYVIGQLFLLLASSLSYVWAYIITEEMPRTGTTEETPTCCQNFMNDALHFLNGVFSFFMPITLIVIIIVKGAQFTAHELDANNTFESGSYISGFVGVWALLGVLLVLSCVFAFGMSVSKLYYPYIVAMVRKITCGKIYARLATEEEIPKVPPNTQIIEKRIFLAQIALDLPVIIGLTMMAVATTLQRGVGDYNLIVTVILLFTTIGLTTHITNVLRLLHVRVQAYKMEKQVTDMQQGLEADRPKPKAETAEQEKRSWEHVVAIRYNRVFIGLIIAAMLFVFVHLAGLDSVQGQEFAPLHQTWFALVAFVILTFGDLSLEFFSVFTKQRYNNKEQYVYKSLLHKSKYTAWLIVLGLYVLTYHQRLWLCPHSTLTMNTEPYLCSSFS